MITAINRTTRKNQQEQNNKNFNYGQTQYLLFKIKHQQSQKAEDKT